MRGGSWNNNSNNCRSANRNNNSPGNSNNNIGFRAVLAPALGSIGRSRLTRTGGGSWSACLQVGRRD
ncbi:MAG: hypothetical protein JKY61_06500 [Planctomycetes bacterium]|nr:hypothetical protein [Planctomycetota bacterium]